MGARYKPRSVLTGIQAGHAMQRAFPRILPDRGLEEVIRQMVRTREDAVLVEDEKTCGVLTKTDLVAAFYGGLPIDTPAGDLVTGSVETCPVTEGLDRVLDRMNERQVHQIYVSDDQDTILGKICHEDVAGLIYKFCRGCTQGRRGQPDRQLPRLTVAEVMTRKVDTCRPTDSLYEVMDLLSQRKVRALPVVNDGLCAVGVVSKTDLVKAYSRGREPWESVGEIMAVPVLVCRPADLLSHALVVMLSGDIQHLFATQGDQREIVGVVSLSDAARFRSGTCRACSISRNF